MKKKYEKYFEYVTTKVKIAIKEKKYTKNGEKIKYILEKNDSKTLIIVFSGFTRIGLKPRYNYNRTLKEFKANKLFILDDFGYDKREAYYLEKNMEFNIKEIIIEFIDKLKKELDIENTIYVGSSKGGYASLYFGVQDKNSIIISGAPQYYLSKYLNGTDNYRENCLKYIIGDDLKQENLDYLDNLLPTIIKEGRINNSKIFLHYSDQEKTYKNHIKFLVNDLNKFKYNYNLDIKKYKNHSDVSIYFPDYIKQVMKSEL